MANYKYLDNLLTNFTSNGLPGCGLQITHHGETIYEGYSGYSNIEKNIPITKNSIFRQASMSKLPLYTTLMMLYEQGKFLLSDPIYDFFPEWKNPTKFIRHETGYIDIVPCTNPVTVKDVLSMKCGLPYCNFPGETNDMTLREMQKYMKPLWEKGHFTNREQIEAMSHVPMAFEPGTHWLYGFSSELAAGIIEAVCGKSIDDVFAEMLFEPLEMKNTSSHYVGDAKERMVQLYQRNADKKLTPIYMSLDDKFNPGPEFECGWSRLYSTVNDFSNLMQMLACGGKFKGEQIMGRKTIDLMRTNGLTKEQLCDLQDTYNAGYGYGMGVRTLIDKYAGNHNGSLGSFGWTGGFGTWCESDPEEEVSIVYMHNMVPNEERYYHLRVRSAAYSIIN